MILKKIGYFDQMDINIRFSKNEYPKQKVVSYLRSGLEIFSWLEDVRCRYQCTKSNLGSVEITDGVWIWTKEFVHYVDCHQMAIPKEFLIFLSERSYTLNENENYAKLKALLTDPTALEAEISYSDNIWKKWVEENSVKIPNINTIQNISSGSGKPKFDIPDDW